MERAVLPELTKAGFRTPSYRTLASALTTDLEALQTTKTSKGTDMRLCGFAHFVNLLWVPVLEYMDSLTSGASPEWTEDLARNYSALGMEMVGIVANADEPLDIDTFANRIKNTLYELLKVDVPETLIMHELSKAGVPFQLAPTPSNARHLLRSRWCQKLVGPALALQASRSILAEIADAPVALISEADLALKVRQDLVDTLGRQVDGNLISLVE